MSVLSNARYERFAQHLAAGVPQGDAYHLAGFESQTAHGRGANSARMLVEHPEIAQRRDELLERQARRKALKADMVLDMLLEDRDLARELGQPSAAIKAVELLGKQLGMFVTKTESKIGITTLEQLSPDQLDAIANMARDDIAAIPGATEATGASGGASEAHPEDQNVLSRSGAFAQGALSEAS